MERSYTLYTVKKIIKFFIFSLLLVCSVYAFAASLTISGVSNLGSGSATVSAPPLQVTDVRYSLYSDDCSLVRVIHVHVKATDGECHTVDVCFIVKSTKTGTVLQQYHYPSQRIDKDGLDYNFIVMQLASIIGKVFLTAEEQV